MRFLPHAHRISLLSPAPVSHIFHSCRPSMPRKQKAALMPTPIKQSHEAMVVSYKPQTLHDTIHTVLPGEVLPAIPSYSEFIAVRLFVFQLTASRRGWLVPIYATPVTIDISTHSLTKRLTEIPKPTCVEIMKFQLTASRRGWQLHLRYSWMWKYFNSQPHEEADDSYFLFLRLYFYFNSQPHEEADPFSIFSIHYTVVFQLTASRRGWRHCSYVPKLWIAISTHSLTKRLTMMLLKI